MANGFATICKKGINKIKGGVKEAFKGERKVYTLNDGSTIVMCDAAWLAKQSAEYEKEFLREDAKNIKTNIARIINHGLKCMARDYWIENTLQSGTYTFQNMLVLKNPYGETPLAALALFVTEKECAVRVTVKGKTPGTDYVSEVPVAKYHRVPILGMYSDYANTVCIELLGENREVVGKRTFTIQTRGLPSELRNKILVQKVSENPAFENIMISGGIDIKTCVFDRNGEIRYYLRRLMKGYGIFPLENGHFFFMEKELATPSFSNPQSVQAYDMDYLGRVHNTYLMETGFHHTVEEKSSDGNLLAGGNSMLEHTEDVVNEIDRKTGEVVWSVNMADLFDEYYQDMMDWAHVNSAAYYDKDKSVIISLRNIHAVICVDYETKNLRWILSDPDFWEPTTMMDKVLKPVGEVPWSYQQHSAFELAEDFDGNPDTKHYIVFDNHWAKRRKAGSFDEDENSYISIYTVNEKEMTVSLHKRFPFIKTRIRSNGILCMDKKRVYAMAGAFAEQPIERYKGGIFEFDYDTGEMVSEFYVKPGFFRAYNFEPNIEAMITPLPIVKDYMAGDLKHPKLVAKEKAETLNFAKASRVKNPEILYLNCEDLFYVKGKDHTIRKVYLVGKKDCYEVDFTDTYQTMEIFENAEYFLSMWFKGLPKDRYKIYLDIEGTIQYTGKYYERF